MLNPFEIQLKNAVDCLKTSLFDPSVTASELGAEIAASYRTIEIVPLPLLFKQCANDEDNNTPLFYAAIALAQRIEDDKAASHHTNGYHNVFHLKKVLLNSFVLSALETKANASFRNLDLIVAAIIHDAYHDGRIPGQSPAAEPFYQEDVSMTFARSFLNAEGVDEKTIHNIHFMLRWTDLSGRKLLDPTVVEPETFEKAKMLGDADILASVGLTPGQALLETRAIEIEWNVKQSPEFYQSFIDLTIPHGMASKAGAYFNDNIPSIVASIKAVLNA